MRECLSFLAIGILFSTVAGCTQSSTAPQIAYSQVVQQVKANNVENVEITSDHAVITLKIAIDDGTGSKQLVYSSTLPTGDAAKSEFTKLLQKESIPFSFAEH